MMRVVATKCFFGEIKPGELFDIESRQDPSRTPGALIVFLRNNDPIPEDQARLIAYRLEVICDD